MLNLLFALAISATALPDTPGVFVKEGFATMDDGVRIYFRLAGGHGEVVVVPVAVLTSPHFDALAKSFRVLYFDPRGRGRSDHGGYKNVSLDRNLKDLDGLRQHLGFNRWAMIGFSGYGLEFARYALDHPQRVTHLVQLAPVPPRLSPWMEPRGAGIRQRIDKAAAAEYETLQKSGKATGAAACEAYQRMMGPAFSTQSQKIDAAAICAHPNEWPENQAKLWTAFMPSLDGIDLRSRVAELKMSRLVIWPERDLIPLDGVKEWVTGSGSSVRLITIADADHSAFIDRPDAVLSAIAQFLRR